MPPSLHSPSTLSRPGSQSTGSAGSLKPVQRFLDSGQRAAISLLYSRSSKLSKTPGSSSGAPSGVPSLQPNGLSLFRVSDNHQPSNI